MKKLTFSLFVSVMLSKYTLFSATSATATVTYSVAAIDPITISGNPGPLNVTSAIAGSAPTSATDATTTYAVTTNTTGGQITGSVATSMPTGVTLSVTLTPPTGATSQGAVELTTTPSSLVTGISNVAQGSLPIVYTLTATVSAAQVIAATNTVTYTIGP